MDETAGEDKRQGEKRGSSLRGDREIVRPQIKVQIMMLFWNVYVRNDSYTHSKVKKNVCIRFYELLYEVM